MIYLIGGVPRVGKSTVASRIREQHSISVLTTDAIRSLLDFSPTKLGLMKLQWKERREVFFPYLLQFLKILQRKYPDYVIEGDIFTPKQVSSIQEEVELRCCFIGASQITLENMKIVPDGNDWVSNMPEEEQAGLPAWTMEESVKLKKECETLGFSYFDIYPNREKALSDCHDFLMRK